MLPIVFSSPRLSSLNGDEKERYKAILSETLDDVRDVLARLPQGVAALLLKAVSYHSEDTVFCAEGKVAIAEWGMVPKNYDRSLHTLSLAGAKPPRYGPGFNGDKVADDTPKAEEPDEAENPFVPTSEEAGVEMEHASNPPQVEEPPIVEEPPVNNDNKGQDKGKKKKRWWLWLLLLIPLLLLLLLLRNCGGDGTKPLPPVTEDDLTSSDDSLTTIVSNRLILLFDVDKPVKDFMKDFRKRYPDKDRYKLFAPDEELPRIYLSLPKEEMREMSERLPDEFAEYGLMVIPETVFDGSRAFTDPAFTDPEQSWYFDMIGAEAAWDNSIGSPDVVVAIIDNEFDIRYPELAGKRIVKPYNAVNHNSTIYSLPGESHGTHVAATAIGMAGNGEGNCGIAPGCSFMPIQVANEHGIMTTSAVVDGVL